MILKNHIAPLEHRPRTLVVFFRNMQLTLAEYHTEGRYRPRIEALMTEGGEPLLEEILRSVRKDEHGTLLELTGRIYPLQKHQLEWQDKIYTKPLILSTPAAAPMLDWKVGAYLCTVVGLYSIPLFIHTAIGHVPLGLPTRSWVAQCVTAMLLFMGVLLLRSSVSTDFIYFQF